MLTATPLRRLTPAGRSLGGRAEPIDVCGQRYGYAPWRFRYRGDLYRVYRVESVRDEGGLLPRRYFMVRCADGTGRTLFQDLRAGTWHLER
ncbi:hypothetical protein K2Z83_27470 [Oscillochloris sp. ZM17-4]|uniref:hypothetical protein n=1 Tax=Oscillochloris sp. ZM17-4 TaxID=2866714 RepID=UPI001C73D6DF|nr:hypothetical protein [Oscillochloris sp. ZM17-4]MBX0331396.1 hypothetical protein [Oscillochloris sp. ZM17-4]